MISWQTIGNNAHLVNIALVCCYATCILVYGEQLKEQGIIDSRWFEEGFCRAELDTADQMHLNAGLAIIATFTTIALLLYRRLYVNATPLDSVGTKSVTEKNEGLDDLYANAKYGMVGVLGHALGHFLISEAIRSGFYPDGDLRGIDDLRKSSALTVARKIIPGYIFFWIPMIKSYMRHTSLFGVILVALVAQIASLFTPMKYGFAFSLSYFFTGFSLDQFLFVPASKKNFAYAVYPLVTVIPTILLAVFEATSCSSSPILMAFGHCFLDSWLGVSYNLYAGLAYFYLAKMSKPQLKSD